MVGNLRLFLQERDAEKKTHPKEKPVPTKDLISKAVMDLETWMTQQKKNFNENLLNIEAQHLNLLGQEWKEREVEREREAQEKMAVMRSLEEELRQELEKIEIERKEMNEKSRALDTEKSNLKNNKLNVIERLKHQLKEKETEILMKSSEIDLLTQKVKHLETETSRKLTRKPSTQERQKSEDMPELNQVSFQFDSRKEQNA